MSEQDPRDPKDPELEAPEETTWTGETGPDADVEASQVDPEAATDIASTAEDAPLAAADADADVTPAADEPAEEDSAATVAGTTEDAPLAASDAPDVPVASAPARPAAPRPARRRDAPRSAEGAAPVVRAQAKYVRTSARKARLVCDHIRGKSVEEARAILAMTPRSVAEDWQKLLESAVANAEHNHELVGDELKVLAVYADEGPTLKRFRPRAMGRATPIRKRTSHLTIQLTPKER
jgi:ribosomal protein L22